MNQGSPSQRLSEMGIPIDRHAAIIALSDQLEAAKRSGAPVSETDRLTIAIGELVEDCLGL